MPLVKSCSINAFRENIRTEVRSGTDNRQAFAIAFSTLQRACKDAGKPLPPGAPTPRPKSK